MYGKNNTGIDKNSTANSQNGEQIAPWNNTPKDGSPRHIVTHPVGNDARSRFHTTSSTNEIEVMNEIISEGFCKSVLPSALLGMAGIFFVRRRFHQMKTTSFENVGLAALHYYGAISLGMLLGIQLYAPTFNKRILERLPNSDAARAIRDMESKSQ